MHKIALFIDKKGKVYNKEERMGMGEYRLCGTC